MQTRTLAVVPHRGQRLVREGFLEERPGSRVVSDLGCQGGGFFRSQSTSLASSVGFAGFSGHTVEQMIFSTDSKTELLCGMRKGPLCLLRALS